MPQCKNCQKEFTISSQEKKALAKFAVPEPKLCITCRWQWLLAFWPFGQFYQRQCDLTGEEIISTFSSQAPFPVYKKENWMKDTWQPPEMEVDLNRPFLDQLVELQKQAPHYHMLSDGKNINCDYCDDIYVSKNCYLTRSCGNGEDLYFSYRMVDNKDCFDCVYCYNLERCYSCTRCWYSYNLFYSLECKNCIDSFWLYDCRGCKNCFLCWNLRNAEYQIKNQQYSKEDYLKELAKINLGSWSAMNKFKKEFREILRKRAIHRVDSNYKSINYSGNYIVESKNSHNCFFLENSEDILNLIRGADNKDLVDCTGAYKMENSYFTDQCFSCYNVKFCNYAIRCRDSEYLDQCDDCHDCFGCVGLRKKKFCILNKEYSEGEYQQLVEKIKSAMIEREEYGDFFPLDLMYTGYNDSFAYHYFPETPENIVARGGWWQTEEVMEQKVDLSENDLPDSIKEVKENDILNKKIKCSKTSKIFRYLPQEIKFYQTNNIPLPRYYYNYRIIENFQQIAPPWPREVKCSKCNQNVVTYYPQEWGYQNIYCQQCYQGEVY